jgi:acetyl esterase/lipase
MLSFASNARYRGIQDMLREVVVGLGIVLWLSNVVVAAEGQKPLPLWPSGAPGEAGDIGPEAEQPAKGDNITRIGNVTEPTLTVFPATGENKSDAAVLIFPGGGYNILAWNLEGTEVAEWFNKIGVTAVVVKYRVPARKGLARHAAPLQDAQRAVGMVRERASEWGIDPKKIGVLGFSAGGHLAATLSTNYDERTYEPVDQADKQSCRPDFTILIYPAYLVDKTTNAISPELKITSETPPTFIAMTADDGVRVEGALFYYLALKNAKVPAEMHLYPVGGHGYGLRESKNLVSSWPARVEDWLRSRELVR